MFCNGAKMKDWFEAVSVSTLFSYARSTNDLHLSILSSAKCYSSNWNYYTDPSILFRSSLQSPFLTGLFTPIASGPLSSRDHNDVAPTTWTSSDAASHWHICYGHHSSTSYSHPHRAPNIKRFHYSNRFHNYRIHHYPRPDQQCCHNRTTNNNHRSPNLYHDHHPRQEWLCPPWDVQCAVRLLS